MKSFKTQINKTWFKWLVQALILIAVILALIIWQQKDMLADYEQPKPVVLEDLNGQMHTLFAQPKNKKTLLYFFAPWCSICHISMPNLANLDKSSVDIYAIALSYQTSAEVDKLISNINYSSVVLLGNDKLAQEFKISAFPSYYVLDENNKIIHKGLGLSSNLSLLWHTR